MNKFRKQISKLLLITSISLILTSILGLIIFALLGLETPALVSYGALGFGLFIVGIFMVSIENIKNDTIYFKEEVDRSNIFIVSYLLASIGIGIILNAFSYTDINIISNAIAIRLFILLPILILFIWSFFRGRIYLKKGYGYAGKPIRISGIYARIISLILIFSILFLMFYEWIL